MRAYPERHFLLYSQAFEKSSCSRAMVAQAFNSSTQVAEAGGISEFEPSQGYSEKKRKTHKIPLARLLDLKLYAIKKSIPLQ